MSSRILVALLAASALLAAGCERAAGTCDALLITGAWVREAPPGAGAAAGYLTVFNSGAGPVTIIGATSPGFARVVMHRTEQIGGIARMRPLETLRVAAGGEVVFQPGGNHLMLIAPRAAFVEGDEVRLKLQCHNGESRSFSAPVRGEAPPEI